MKKLALLSVFVSAGALLSGCTTVPCCTAGRDVRVVPQQVGPCCSNSGAEARVVEMRAIPQQTQKILAVGYGAMGGSQSHLTLGQQKLMAMRAARVDAYRNLAEQVYGFRIWGNTAVSSFATQNDNIRTYVDSFIRGARLVNMTPIADGNFEATVELDLTPAFFSCVANVTSAASCNVPAAVSLSENNCSAAGCVQPSAYYYTTQ